MKVRVYTDGACSSNGKRGAKAAWAFYFPDNPSLSDAGKVPEDQPQTNNRGELSAILHGVNKALASFTPSDVALHIFTDSDYSKNCLTLWMPGWIKKNWMTTASKPVANRDLIEEISGKLVMFQSYCVTWVKAHTGGDDEHSKYNHIVDQMAVEALEGPKPKAAPIPVKEIEGCPLQMMGPPVSDTDLVKWCLANTDKLDQDALNSAILSALSKTFVKNGTEMVKQKLHRSTQYRLIASTHILTSNNKEE
jgi:ribonuclease HI